MVDSGPEIMWTGEQEKGRRRSLFPATELDNSQHHPISSSSSAVTTLMEKFDSKVEYQIGATSEGLRGRRTNGGLHVNNRIFCPLSAVEACT